MGETVMMKKGSARDRLLEKRARELIRNGSGNELDKDGLITTLLQSFPEYQRRDKREVEKIVSRLFMDGQERKRDFAAMKQDGELGTPDGKQKGKKRRRAMTNSSSMKAKAHKHVPSARLKDLGGVDNVLSTVRELCEYPLLHRNVYRHLGVKPPCGILLCGPPGCGKTLLAHAIAGELGVNFFKVSAPEIVTGMSGESEERVRELFIDAQANAPSIIFIDEIDAITGKRESSSRGMERRIVAQLLTCMDSLLLDSARSSKDDDEPEESELEEEKAVIVIGATNMPDALDPALRRAGRFDREISLGIPDLEGRQRILERLAERMRLEGNFDFRKIGQLTPGFVGADLSAVCKEAAMGTVNRVFASKQDSSRGSPFSAQELQSMFVTMDDFVQAIKKVQPSAKREGFVTVPQVTFDDIGALEQVREELKFAITEPIKNPEKYAKMGLTIPAGVLLYGPPGCGKTLLAKAVANSSGANFISVKGPELLNKFVGESERAVRQVFARARASCPCVVFFDEIDSLVPKRSSSSDNNGVTERVVNQLLTELDGLEQRKDVFVVAATNRADIIDEAMLRPGRLDKLLYVPLPSPHDRIAIMKTAARKTPLHPDLVAELPSIASSSNLDGFSGADIASLVREAATIALASDEVLVTSSHVRRALKKVKPSVRSPSAYQKLNPFA